MRPETSDKRVVTIGRITTGVIMVLAMLWSTQGDQFGTIFEAINKIPMTFAPAVTTVFVLGVMWKRGTKQAAMATLYIGSLIGIIYFLVDMPGIGKMILGAGKAHPDFTGLITDPLRWPGHSLHAGRPDPHRVLRRHLHPHQPDDARRWTPKEVAKVCWDHPLAFLKGRITGASDPRIVTLILLLVVGVLYVWLH